MHYLRDTRKHNTKKHTGSSQVMRKLNTDLMKHLSFEEIMEIINANHGFYYNKDSK